MTTVLARLGETWSRLRQRDRRALRLAAIVLMPALLYVGAVDPYARALRDARERLLTERGLLARETALIGTASRYPTLLQHARDELHRATPRLFEGPDSLTAAAALVEYAAAQAEKAGMVVDARETHVGDSPNKGLAALEVTLRGRGDLEAVLDFLQSLEHGTKLVRITRLDIEPDALPVGSAAAADRDMETLRIAVAVRGLAALREGDVNETQASNNAVPTGVVARGARR